MSCVPCVRAGGRGEAAWERECRDVPPEARGRRAKKYPLVVVIAPPLPGRCPAGARVPGCPVPGCPVPGRCPAGAQPVPGARVPGARLLGVRLLGGWWCRNEKKIAALRAVNVKSL